MAAGTTGHRKLQSRLARLVDLNEMWVKWMGWKPLRPLSPCGRIQEVLESSMLRLNSLYVVGAGSVPSSMSSW